MKELSFICAQPDDQYYTWQVHTWLESLRQIGYSDDAIILIFTPNFREPNLTTWKEIEKLYPEATFYYYKDTDNISKTLSIYIPVIRPYILMKYFQEHPQMVNRALFYCDSDVVFTKDFNIDDYINDDICYLSNTNSYINSSYFDSKVKDVKPELLEDYKKRDILAELTSIIGINRETCERNKDHSGGAQYLLKNIGASFWEKVIGDCLVIKTYLSNVNKQFFESESKGFQSWCADMWAVLWNLWLREQETKVIPELDFAWSTDDISALQKNKILHNAGVTGDAMMDGVPMFYKGTYHTGKDPFKDERLIKVLNDERNQRFCNNHYLKQMFDVKKKYKLNY